MTNSLWMYMLGVLVVVFVLSGSIFYIVKSYKDAKKVNMDRKVLRKTIVSSALFTILPSISILVGVVTLAGKLGVPLPWIRLSVIGALHYEGMAAAAAGGDFTIETLTPQLFVTIATVMTLGILSGPLFCLFGFKLYDKKVLAKAKESEEEKVTNEKPKKSFGSILFNAVFIAMISAYVVWDCVKPYVTDAEKLKESGSNFLVDKPYTSIVVVLVSFVCMALFDFLEKKCKQKWLSNFSLGLSMLIAMAVAVLISL